MKIEKIPPGTEIPQLPKFNLSKHHSEVIELIEKNFKTHSGSLQNIWFPVRRKDANKQLRIFLKQRFSNFGINEDAMLENENFLFHSCLSVNMNIGLLTPKEVVKKAFKIWRKRICAIKFS